MKQTAGIIFRSVIFLIIGIVIGVLFSNRPPNEDDTTLLAANSNKLEKVMQLVRKKYVDPVNVDSVENVTINNLLQKLDPHSIYLQKKQAQSLTEKLEGGFDGIGIESQILRDTLFVTQILPNSPAARAGLPNGSRIVTINGRPFSGTHLTSDKVNETFADSKDTGLELGVINPADGMLKKYHIRRGHISLSSLDAAYLAAPATGYIKISKFGAATDADFKVALTRLKKNGMQKLVLDLRGNGGGYLTAATALADEFLPKNKLIVYTQGQHEPRTDYFATDSGAFEQGKLAVLIDEHSASASEIVAGALQDLDRAVIVGRRSFGKGLVQEQFGFDDGSALNLTVARYFTPSGRSIQKFYRNGADTYRKELADRLQKGEMYVAQNNLEDSTSVNPSAYRTSAGKKVYSGGGIMPDVFVPEDAAVNVPLIQDLARGQVFSGYVVEQMQGILKNYATPSDFARFYSVNDYELNSFISYATQVLGSLDARQVNTARNYLKLLIKAQTARFKWGNEWYYRIMNQNDADLVKAIAALN
jgi:carboxyl-terminal processing protease